MKMPEKVTIRQLINTRKVFIVPKYQRTYAWEDEEVDDFIRDMTDLYTVRVTNKETMQHFLGGFVSIETQEANTDPAHKYQVVDGQQRLSTFMLALSLVVQALEMLMDDVSDPNEKQKATNFAENIRKFLRYERLDNLTGQKTEPPTLTLSKSDCDFFEELIDGKHKPDSPEPSASSHKRLFYAYQQIHKRLIKSIIDDGNLSESGKINRIITLQQALLDDCYVIHIISETLSEGYRLFSILNDRGQRLSDADLLRSHTLGLLEGNLLQSKLEKYWDHLAEGSFEAVDNFLRSYYVSCQGERPSRGGLFDDYVSKYFNYRIGTIVRDDLETQRIEERVESISSEWDTYIRIANGAWPYEDSRIGDWYRNRLYLLVKTLRHDLCIPLLLSAYQKFDENEFARLINILERFYFRYKIIVNEHMGSIGNLYYEYSKGIREEDPKYTLSALKIELQTRIKDKADDTIFDPKLSNELIYQERSTTRKNTIKYFLITLEDYLQWYRQGASGEPRANDRGDLDIGKVTIDHIYPQNPQSPHSDIGDIKHTLGNLALLGGSDNSSASNKQPSEKKEVYRNENKISLTTSLVARVDTWDIATIGNREKELIKMALKIFIL